MTSKVHRWGNRTDRVVPGSRWVGTVAGSWGRKEGRIEWAEGAVLACTGLVDERTCTRSRSGRQGSSGKGSCELFREEEGSPVQKGFGRSACGEEEHSKALYRQASLVEVQASEGNSRRQAGEGSTRSRPGRRGWSPPLAPGGRHPQAVA